MEKMLLPEVESEAKKKTSFSEVFAGIKKRLQELVDWLFSETENDKLRKEVETFEKTIQKSLSVGEVTHKFYQSLIPQGLRKPTKEYAPKTVRKRSEFLETALKETEKIKLHSQNLPEEQVKFWREKVNKFEEIERVPSGISEKTLGGGLCRKKVFTKKGKREVRISLLKALPIFSQKKATWHNLIFLLKIKPPARCLI